MGIYRSRGRYGRAKDDLRSGLREVKPEAPIMRSRDLKLFDAIEVAHLHLLPGEVETLPTSGHQVNLHLSSEPHHLVQRRNERTHEGFKDPGVVDVIPAYTASYFRMDAASEHVCMFLKDHFVRRVAVEAEADPDGFEVVPCFNAPDPRIEGLGLSLLSELMSGGLGGELYSESLANVLALQLLREHSSLGRGSRRRIAHESERGEGLSNRSLARAIDYINDNLHRKLRLEEIAGAANMSPHHFARFFKKETGLPPYRYVVQKRVERARRLVANTEMNLAEVARTVGFSSQSHLTSHFRRLLGVSPGVLRREGTR